METIGRAEGGYERVEADLTAERAGLDDREWEVLRLRFVDELTQREIGRRLGVSQMQISRISRAALWKLLNAVRGGERHPAAPPAQRPPDEAVLKRSSCRMQRVDGRTLTSFPSLRTDIRNAGGTWVDEEVHVEAGLVTSRKPDDLDAFCAKAVEEIAEGVHAEQRAATVGS